MPITAVLERVCPFYLQFYRHLSEASQDLTFFFFWQKEIGWYFHRKHKLCYFWVIIDSQLITMYAKLFFVCASLHVEEMHCVSSTPLTWRRLNHILWFICRTVASRLREVINPLYLVLVRSHLWYCVQLWVPSYKTDVDILKQAQQRPWKWSEAGPHDVTRKSAKWTGLVQL